MSPTSAVLLFADPAPNGHDARAFTYYVLTIQPQLPGLRVGYVRHGVARGGLRSTVESRCPPAGQDATGLQEQAAIKGKVGGRMLRTPAGQMVERLVFAFDGRPAIEVVIAGSKNLVCFERQQTKPSHEDIYNTWKLPDWTPPVPRELRGATLRDSDELDGTRASPLSRAPSSLLRTIPEADHDFTLFGGRNDTESINNEYQHTLYQQGSCRASSFGLQRQRSDLLGFALLTNLQAALAHEFRGHALPGVLAPEANASRC